MKEYKLWGHWARVVARLGSAKRIAEKVLLTRGRENENARARKHR